MFSFDEDPDAAVAVIEDLASALERDIPVFVEMGEVEVVSANALYALAGVSLLKPVVGVKGNLPHLPAAAKFVKDSGCFDGMNHSWSGVSTGLLRLIRGLKAEPRSVAKVQEFLAVDSTGSAKTPYSVLLEAIGNTEEHAREQWLIGAMRWEGKQFVVALDRGPGICRTWRGKPTFAERLGLDLTATSDLEILNGLFFEKWGSSTRQPHRGNGLPTMADFVEQGNFQRMTVVTNGAMMHLPTRAGVALGRRFRGTLLSWELNDDEHASPS